MHWLLIVLLFFGQAQAQTLFSGGHQQPGNTVINNSALGFGPGEFAFLNFFKTTLSQSAASNYAYPSILNANGYPTSAPSQTISGTTGLPTNYSGQWVIKWSGTGRIRLDRGSPGYTVVADPGSCVQGSTGFNLDVSGANCRVVFTFTTSAASGISVLFLTTGTYSGMVDAVLCQIADEAAIDAGEYFRDDYLNVVRQINPKVMRHLGWFNVNNSNNFTNWIYRTPIAAFTYGSPTWPPALWGGTVSGTDTYTIAAASGSPADWTDREQIQGQFTNANTITTPTLTISGHTGAKTIVNSSGNALSSGSIAANALATMVYDATLDQVIYTSGGQTSDVPFEVQIALCNKLKIDCWSNLAHLITDASATSYATYVRDNLTAAWHVEYSNEIWNFGDNQTTWAVNVGAALGFPADNNRRYQGYYGLRFRQLMGLITAAWSPRTLNDLKRTMAFQAFGVVASTNTYRFQGSDLGAYGYNSAPNRPIDYSDRESYATYYQGAIINDGNSYSGSYAAGDLADCSVAGTNSGGMTCAANNYTLGTTASINAAYAWVDNDIRAGTKNSTLGSQTLLGLSTNIYGAWNANASGYGLLVDAYEGGYQGLAPTVAQCTTISYPGTGAVDCGASGTIATMMAAYKNTDRFRQLVNDQYRQFKAVSQSNAPAWLTIAPISQWSLFPGNIYTTAYQSLPALKNFNAAP